jgi:hypothetical protein
LELDQSCKLNIIKDNESWKGSIFLVNGNEEYKI